MIIRIMGFIAKKDAEYPEDPARKVYNGGRYDQSWLGTPGASGFGNSATTTHHLPPQYEPWVKYSLDEDVDSVKVEERLKVTCARTRIENM
jgi:hypothetical protein